MASFSESLGVQEQPSRLTNAVLDLEQIEQNLYRASNQWVEYKGKNLYGGQVVCQAMVAACKTVEPQLHINSLHCYFVRKGSTQIPVVYTVENLRDGKSFCTRSVHAIQNGKAILIMILSFHIKEDSPFHHQPTMPDVPMPEDLLSTKDILDKFFSGASDGVKSKIKSSEGSGKTLEFRHVDVEQLFKIKAHKPKKLVWVRVQGKLDGDENVHRCAAAFISDTFMAWTSYLPYYHVKLGLLASLDHSIWFHEPFRADEWLLFEMESPKSSGGRGMAFGRLWHRDGRLVASISQECVMRPKL